MTHMQVRCSPLYCVLLMLCDSTTRPYDVTYLLGCSQTVSHMQALLLAIKEHTGSGSMPILQVISPCKREGVAMKDYSIRLHVRI